MKRTVTILITLLIINLPIGCGDGVDCGGFTLFETTISELSSSVGSYVENFALSSSTDYQTAAIQISIESMNLTEVSQASSPRFSFLSAAYACSPPEPQPTQAIESIEITSVSPVSFNTVEYSSGENLVALFKVVDYYTKSDSDDISISQFIELQKQDLWIFGYEGISIVFQLQENPDNPINQQFTFKFKFSDSTEIEVQTPNFEVEN